MSPDILLSIFTLIVLFFSIVIHEIAHGSVAYSLGDPTAKYEGRLTLNPLKHIDPFGSIILPLLLFITGSPILVGWAKPVPINPYNFRDQKWGTLKVSIAGPATNLAVALVFGLIIRFAGLPSDLIFTKLLSIVVFYNFLWAVFNLLPIPPLDGSWILFRFLPQSLSGFKAALNQYGVFILIFFLLFGGGQFLNYIASILYGLVV